MHRIILAIFLMLLTGCTSFAPNSSVNQQSIADQEQNVSQQSNVDQKLNASDVKIINDRTQQIGPIWDSERDEDYSLEITLQDVRWQDLEYASENEELLYVITELKITNLGPGGVYEVGPWLFDMMDEQGAVGNYKYGFPDNCDFNEVDLRPKGAVTGCVAFKVPKSGKLTLILAPFKRNKLQQGRFVAFDLRQ